ncbi:hypothetical protein RJ639_027606 [Escallonia herrerae]|uniref:Uncharacterized protein n=1 Tax=Escallonia herrerae TaxID=1293975 RepID=A0AA88X3Q9_9ASTE|nr:hypothetical protein RJ639_027606 [Escallonia herrerae]
MVTRFSSISTRKLSSALKTLTFGKTMVAMSDYGEFHKMMKRLVLTNVLGPNAQKRHRIHRETLMEKCSSKLQAHLKRCPLEAVLGKDVASIHVKELETTLSREEIFKVLVTGPMEGAIEVDWRDFFPYLKWIPNKSFERKIQQMCIQREALMKALIQEQKKRIDSEKLFTMAGMETGYRLLSRLLVVWSQNTIRVNCIPRGPSILFWHDFDSLKPIGPSLSGNSKYL